VQLRCHNHLLTHRSCAVGPTVPAQPLCTGAPLPQLGAVPDRDVRKTAEHHCVRYHCAIFTPGFSPVNRPACLRVANGVSDTPARAPCAGVNAPLLRTARSRASCLRVATLPTDAAARRAVTPAPVLMVAVSAGMRHCGVQCRRPRQHGRRANPGSGSRAPCRQSAGIGLISVRNSCSIRKKVDGRQGDRD
jgi:hypothetical protein